MADKAYWLVDANGAWSTGGNWATQVPGSNPPTYTATVPSAGYAVSITPFDPVAGTATGTSPFTITYNTTDTITSLTGPAFATLAVQGGTLTVTTTLTDSGTVTLAAGTLDIQNSGGTASSIGGLTQTGGTLKVDAGTLTVTGASSIAGTVAGAGTVVFGGSSTIAAGAKVTVTRLSVGTSGTTLTIGANLAYAGAFSQQAGTTLALTGGTMLLTGTANLSGATINGSKVFYTEGSGAIGGGLTIGGTVTFFNTKTMSQAGGTVTVGDTSGGVATLSNAAGAFYVITDDSGIARGSAVGSRIVNRGAFRKTGGTGTSTVTASFYDTGTVAVTTGTLSFTGPANSFAGAITGAGTVLFAGGNTTLGSGTTASVAGLTTSGSTTTVTVAADLTYAGIFAQGAGSTLSILAGDTLTLTGTDTLGGKVTGAGTLVLNGNTSLSAALTVNNLDLTGGTLTLTKSVTYAGTYTQTGGATVVTGNGLALTLTGAASLTNAVVGSGSRMQVEGPTTVAGLEVNGIFRNSKTVTQAGGDVVLNAQGSQILNLPGAVWNITDDSDFVADGGQAFNNQGTLEKTGGSGVSYIRFVQNSSVSNTGTATVAVSSGTMEIYSVTNYGNMNMLVGTTLILDGPLTMTGFNDVAINLTGSNATLQLKDVEQFQAATIAGFSGGKTIDLGEVGFGSGITDSLAYSGDTTHGTLTVSDGIHTANLKMLGNYAQSNFHLGTDSHGGSAITFA